MINGYLSHAVRLSLVLMLVDARFGLRTLDVNMLSRLQYYNKRVQVVYSKVDRILHPTLLTQNLEKTTLQLQAYPNAYPEIYLLSSHDGYGVTQLKTRIITHL